MKNLIGLAGCAGVGKSTIARMLHVNLGYRRTAFADPLKEALSIITGLSLNHFYNIKLKEKQTEYGKTPRQMMQMGGTEFVRNMINPDFWIIRMQKELNQFFPNERIVVDDIRFENEAELIRKNNGIVIHLKRKFELVTKENNHASEAELKPKYNDYIVLTPENMGENYTFDIIKNIIINQNL